MIKETPILDRIYFWPEYSAVARAIGYAGIPYMQLTKVIEELSTKFPKAKVESVIFNLTTFEGQMTVHPPPLAQVKFREHVKPLLWQLLGPPPEKEDAFWTNRDGSKIPRPAKEEPKAPEPSQAPPEEKPAEPEAKPARKRTRKAK